MIFFFFHWWFFVSLIDSLWILIFWTLSPLARFGFDATFLFQCMDFGFHSSIARALLTHVSGQECVRRSLQSGIDELNKTINNLDSRLDKQRFLEQNNAAFMLPKKFEFQGHKGDEVSERPLTPHGGQTHNGKLARFESKYVLLHSHSFQLSFAYMWMTRVLIWWCSFQDFFINFVSFLFVQLFCFSRFFSAWEIGEPHLPPSQIEV